MIFKKLFGGGKSQLEVGDEAFANGQYGSALMAYRRVKAKGADAKAALEEKISNCKDQLGLERLAEARRLHEQGSPALRDEELAGALEVATGAAARAEIEAFVTELKRAHAQDTRSVVEISEDERWTVLVSQWSVAQRDELLAYGEGLKQGVMAFHRGDFDSAIDALTALDQEQVPGSDEAPRYLWLELARTHLALDALDETEAALSNYLEATDAEAIDEPWLGSRIALAQLADKRGDFDLAMEHFSEAIAAFEEDPRPYLAMGSFLRQRDCPEEARDVLLAAKPLADGSQSQWATNLELGLAIRDCGDHAEAMAVLESIVEFFVKAKHIDFPPSLVIPLAKLHEEHGKKQRAADLWASLTRGSDSARHAHYHLETARVLGELGMEEAAKRHQAQAEAIEAKVESETETLGGSSSEEE